jgi:tetratricopeptide (TPR) repeat protein
MALCAQDMGDRERADRFFREATEAESWSGSWFNWALAKERWEHFQDAVDCVKKAWSIEQDPAYLVLQARLAHKMRNETERDKLLKEALRLFGPISGLSDFSLGWLGCGARLAGDDALAVRAEAELRARRQAKGQRVDEEGELVDHKSLPMRVNE